MSGDRTIDALIAEKVFGLRVEITQEETSGYAPGARWVGGGEYYEEDVYWAVPSNKYEAWASKEEHDDDWYLAPYSTEVGWAWQIVERFIPAHGWTQDQYNTRRLFWDAMRDGPRTPLWAWPADKAAMIICRAALEALGIEA